ncbi:hypothetical protein ACP70R_044483 [Stipagrostis hirtigluma subsp. patula]
MGSSVGSDLGCNPFSPRGHDCSLRSERRRRRRSVRRRRDTATAPPPIQRRRRLLPLGCCFLRRGVLHESVFFVSGLPSLLFERLGLFAKYENTRSSLLAESIPEAATLLRGRRRISQEDQTPLNKKNKKESYQELEERIISLIASLFVFFIF